MKQNNINIVLKLIKKECRKYNNPIVTEISDLTKNPFKVLISCILSLRTKDAVTAKASKRLFEIADTPEKILKLRTKEIEKLIYPVGFYKTKAKNLKILCRQLLDNHKGKVPHSEEDLLKLKNVGRKTMNIVRTYGFDDPEGLAIDIHCFRIPNRLGWVKTKTPEETEFVLRKTLPKKYWRDFNDIFGNVFLNTNSV